MVIGASGFWLYEKLTSLELCGVHSIIRLPSHDEPSMSTTNIRVTLGYLGTFKGSARTPVQYKYVQVAACKADRCLFRQCVVSLHKM